MTTQAIKDETTRQLCRAGYERTSVVAAVAAEDIGLLVHTGRYDVRLPDPSGATDGRERSGP